MLDARTSWDRRAESRQRNLDGVLFKGLSNEANRVLHEWHSWIVRECWLPQMESGACVLDLGCGYGRLAEIVKHSRSDVTVIGQDLAMPYCRLFSEGGSLVVQAGLETPPFADKCFDGVLAITSLMYARRSTIGVTLSRLAQLLKPGGVALFLDPGAELQRFLGYFSGGSKSSPTGGSGFSSDEYKKLLAATGFESMASGGNPGFTLGVTALGLRNPSTNLQANLLRRLAGFDYREAGFRGYVLHRWMLVKRVEAPH